jgi:hypothetical protein
MEDKAYLDRKYFIDTSVYNCPFCNRNNVNYKLLSKGIFDWTTEKNVMYTWLNVHHVGIYQCTYLMRT